MTFEEHSIVSSERESLFVSEKINAQEKEIVTPHMILGRRERLHLANVKARLCTNVTFLVCLLFLTYSNEVLLTITGDQKNKNAINV